MGTLAGSRQIPGAASEFAALPCPLARTAPAKPPSRPAERDRKPAQTQGPAGFSPARQWQQHGI